MKKASAASFFFVCLALAVFAAGCKGKQSTEGKTEQVSEPAAAVTDEAAAAAVPQAPVETPAAANPQVVIATSMGDIKVELFADKAPVTVKNFLSYADKGTYDGTIFHRVILGFMIQGGGMEPGLKEKQPDPPIRNEARSDLPNVRGTIAMARTDVVDSATSQFFINQVDNAKLDHGDDTVLGFGYCVFGKVIEGMDVVDTIASVATTTVGPFENVPKDDVLIKSVKRIEP
jgi:cyclophilin family peptidyl-prolyl cis-trans isomerase